MSETGVMPKQTYDSKSIDYLLDPRTVYRVIRDVDDYFYHLHRREETLPLSRRNGRKVITGIVENESLKPFTLAEFYLTEDGGEVRLKFNAHPNVAIDPTDLIEIAKKYQLKH